MKTYGNEDFYNLIDSKLDEQKNQSINKSKLVRNLKHGALKNSKTSDINTAVNAAVKQMDGIQPVNKTFINRTIRTIFDSIEKLVNRGDAVRIANFGKFSRKHVQARNGHNIRTGAAITIPAHNRPKFTTSIDWKRNVK